MFYEWLTKDIDTRYRLNVSNNQYKNCEDCTVIFEVKGDLIIEDKSDLKEFGCEVLIQKI